MSEVKKSWNAFKMAVEFLRDGEISMNQFDASFERFYADAEPVIENLEDEDDE